MTIYRYRQVDHRVAGRQKTKNESWVDDCQQQLGDWWRVININTTVAAFLTVHWQLTANCGHRLKRWHAACRRHIINYARVVWTGHKYDIAIWRLHVDCRLWTSLAWRSSCTRPLTFSTKIFRRKLNIHDSTAEWVWSADVRDWQTAGALRRPPASPGCE